MRISRGPTALLFAAIMAMVATDVMSQPPDGGQRGGRGGFGRGPGGPGGGGPGRGGFGRGGGGGGSLIGLLGVAEVREEVELLPDQEEALKKVRENMGDRPRIRPPEGISDFRNPTPEDEKKIAKFREEMQKANEERAAKELGLLEEVLFPEQLERLQQIQVQQMGTYALMDARVIKVLKISDKQQGELREAAEKAMGDMRTKMGELFRSGNREGIREAMEEARKETEKTVLAVLTSDQKKKFDEMKGEPFEMPRPQFGGRGGPGGDRGGRGRPGGDRGGRPGGDRGGRPGGGRPSAE